jgi:myo-inositol-1(or 4)-monophosphatase
LIRPTLLDLETLACRAGEILRAGFGAHHQIDKKGAIDLVTEVDHRSEAFIKGEIQRRFTSHRIIAEESGILSGEACCAWIVDPLDGTVNYAHGVPIFSVSIAFQLNGVVILGAVYDPMKDECFSAEKGKGAWLNGTSIHVSATDNLNDSLLVTGFPYDIRTNPENNLAHYANFATLTQGVRRLGSAALDLCYVGSGRFDGFWELRLSPWDLAAGGLIAREAGATVTDLVGGKEYLSPPNSVLAATPGIHAAMLAVLTKNGSA